MDLLNPTELLGREIHDLEKQLLWTRRVLNAVCYYIQDKFGREDDLPKEILKPEYFEFGRPVEPSAPDETGAETEILIPGADASIIESETPAPGPAAHPIFLLISQPQPQTPATPVPATPAPKSRPKFMKNGKRIRVRQCTKPSPYSCTYCSKYFISQEMLERHEMVQCSGKLDPSLQEDVLKTKHVGPRGPRQTKFRSPFACDACDKCFVSDDKLRKHKMVQCFVKLERLAAEENQSDEQEPVTEQRRSRRISGSATKSTASSSYGGSYSNLNDVDNENGGEELENEDQKDPLALEDEKDVPGPYDGDDDFVPEDSDEAESSSSTDDEDYVPEGQSRNLKRKPKKQTIDLIELDSDDSEDERAWGRGPGGRPKLSSTTPGKAPHPKNALLQSSKYLCKRERGTFICDYCEGDSGQWEMCRDRSKIEKEINTYNRMNNLMLHKDDVHPQQFSEELKRNQISRKQLGYACPICDDMWFGRKANCINHIGYFHKDMLESASPGGLVPKEELFQNEYIVPVDEGQRIDLICRQCPDNESRIPHENPAFLKLHKLKTHAKVKPYICKKKKNKVEEGPRKRTRTPKCRPAPDSPTKCEICQITFKKLIGYLKHLKILHVADFEKIIEERPDLKSLSEELSCPYYCSSCKLNCVDQVGLDAHNSESHFFPCPHCPKVLRYSGTRKTHISTVHLNIKIRKYLCNICGQRLKGNHALKRHMEIHGDPKYYCHLCSYKGRQQMSLRLHLENSHNIYSEGRKAEAIPKPCHLCGELFKMRFMQKHIDTVHYNKRPYPCHLCEKKFKTNTHLKYHIKTHSNPNGRKRGLNKEREPIRRKGVIKKSKNANAIIISTIEMANVIKNSIPENVEDYVS